MAEPTEKKGFWKGLFRTRSNAKGGKLAKEQPKHVVNDGNGNTPPQRYGQHTHTSTSPTASPTPKGHTHSTRRRTRRPEPRKSKGKDKARANGLGADEDGEDDEEAPLTEWPPPGLQPDAELSLGHAMQRIARGVPAHKGHRRSVPHASDAYYSLFATSAGNAGDEGDGADAHATMTQLMSLRLVGGSTNSGSGAGPKDNGPIYPWDTLEQPSMAFGPGARPGTVTLNAWVARSSNPAPPIALRDPGFRVRASVGLETIFARLKELETYGLESGETGEDDERRYRALYRRFLRDPDRGGANAHVRMEQQITDLVMALSSAVPDTTATAPAATSTSASASEHSAASAGTETLIDWIDFSLPRNQVATRWIYDGGASPAAAATYRRFAYQLLLGLELDLRIGAKAHAAWSRERLLASIPPRLQWTLALARRWRANVRVEDYGPDPDAVRLRFKMRKRQTRMLKRFAQMMKWPNLGEVVEALRRGDADASLPWVSSHAMAFFSGLVLPGIARIRTRKPRQVMTPEDVTSMSERSDPLGPAAEVYPVKEYELLMPDFDDIPDTVRVELLSLKPLSGPAEKQEAGSNSSNANGTGLVETKVPKVFDASIRFAIDGVSWPLRLSYDVVFLHAWPCSEGPHPLFFDYSYTAVKADEIIGIHDWGRAPQAERTGSANSTPTKGITQGDDEERVLVIEAFGVRDNEVLARAWCAHWGLNAVVADIGKTCTACAIREAYAATLTVVILVEDLPEGAE
ncbi:hypothetical protein F4780DRAFT_789283 [Xylariomycetidae sp. FL0641]|nr:hypothetical protein F4780DRAFT_789283 [Xylariomycetidae sp. FL0641]